MSRGREVSYNLACFWEHTPNHHRKSVLNATGTLLYRPKHIQVYKHEHRASGSSACPIKSQYRILAVSLYQLERMCLCPLLSTRVK